MSKLTYSQLEGVWIQSGGQASLAPLMAAIALAESGGNPDSLNATDNDGTQSSFGLWQISTGTHTPPNPNWNDPIENAKLAQGKLKSQGLSAWGTYTSGAYKPFLKNGVPATNVAPGMSTTSVDAGETTPAFDSADCAWQVKLPAAGQTCILSKVQVRDIVALFLVSGAIVIGIFGVAALAAFSLGKNPGAVVKAISHGAGV